MAKHFKDNTPEAHSVQKTSVSRSAARANAPAQRGAYKPNSFGKAGQTGAYVGKDARKAPKKKGNLISTILLVVGIVCIVVAAGLFIYAQMQYGAQAANNAKLAEYATVSDEEGTEEGPVVDWAGLKAINDDVVGWIQVPGTVVNYPVYQGVDNNEYLHTTAEGEYTLGGQVFMDYENAAPGMVDRQTILYGHHLQDGTMFAAIDDMCEQDKFDAVDTVWYATENETCGVSFESVLSDVTGLLQ